MDHPNQSPDPSIEFWANRNLERCRAAAQARYRREHAQRVNRCIDAFLERERAALQARPQQVAA